MANGDWRTIKHLNRGGSRTALRHAKKVKSRA
jgi:hypothetical protein